MAITKLVDMFSLIANFKLTADEAQLCSVYTLRKVHESTINAIIGNKLTQGGREYDIIWHIGDDEDAVTEHYWLSFRSIPVENVAQYYASEDASPKTELNFVIIQPARK